MATDIDKIRWGILGTGWVATDFAAALQETPGAVLQAVGSRSAENAEAFGGKFDIPNRHANYNALVADPDVDIVHIATPHILHKEHAILALEHGKAVLCEKPFTLNAAQAAELIGVARSRGVFLMEAMWGRFTPGQVKVRELLEAGAIGEVQMFTGHFGARKTYDPANRYFSRELAGGALLDVGVYPIALASMVMGEPDHVYSALRIGETGVDHWGAVLLEYPGGRTATVSASIRTRTPRDVLIAGSEGCIRVDSPLTRPPRVTLERHGEQPREFDTSFEGSGFVFEIVEAMRCLREGLIESPRMPLDETLSIMKTMDTVREQAGLVYPGEK